MGRDSERERQKGIQNPFTGIRACHSRHLAYLVFFRQSLPLAIMVNARLGYRAAVSLPWGIRFQKADKLNPGENDAESRLDIEPACLNY
uniref:hypothetical protein n=1 Tax=Dyadobacter sp. OTU695 TaxID=3043860 RepID=UPI00313DC7BE